MDAVFGSSNWSMRGAVLPWLCLVAITLLAVGAAGFLMTGGATPVVTHTANTTAVPPAPEPAPVLLAPPIGFD